MPPFPDLLETPRLLIRPCEPARAELVNAAIRASFPELHLWLPWADHVPEVAETLAHLTQAEQKFRTGEDCGLILWRRDTGDCVGASGLHPRPKDANWREIGYWIHTQHAGQGLATEAVRHITTAGFDALGLEGIQLKASERNVASQRVAERAGFVAAAIVDDGRVDGDGQPSRTMLYIRRRTDPRP